MTNVFDGEPDGRQAADVNFRVSRFRPVYRALTDDEKALHDEIKTKAWELEGLIERVGATPGAPQVNPDAPRYKALAMTALEQSVMWAVKALTA